MYPLRLRSIAVASLSLRSKTGHVDLPKSEAYTYVQLSSELKEGEVKLVLESNRVVVVGSKNGETVGIDERTFLQRLAKATNSPARRIDCYRSERSEDRWDRREYPVYPRWQNNSCALDCIVAIVSNCSDPRWARALALPTDDIAELRRLLPQKYRGACSVYEAYTALCTIGNGAQFYVPVTVLTWRERMDMFEPEERIEWSCVRSMREFSEEAPLGEFGKKAKIVQWSRCASDWLVFFNEGQEAHRGFDLSIIDDRYRLRGAIVLTDRPQNGEEGHYVAVIFDRNRWVMYDGLRSDVVELDEKKARSWAFTTKHGVPSLYFYSRVSNERTLLGAELTLHDKEVKKRLYYSDGSVLQEDGTVRFDDE